MIKSTQVNENTSSFDSLLPSVSLGTVEGNYGQQLMQNTSSYNIQRNKQFRYEIAQCIYNLCLKFQRRNALVHLGYHTLIRARRMLLSYRMHHLSKG